MGKHVAEKISLYLDKELKGKELESFKKHVASCKKCAAELSQITHAVDALKHGKKQALSADFYARLSDKLDEVDARKLAKYPFFNWAVFTRGAAAVCAMVLVFVMADQYLQISKNFTTPKMTEATDQMQIALQAAGEDEKAQEETVKAQEFVKEKSRSLSKAEIAKVQSFRLGKTDTLRTKSAAAGMAADSAGDAFPEVQMNAPSEAPARAAAPEAKISRIEEASAPAVSKKAIQPVLKQWAGFYNAGSMKETFAITGAAQLALFAEKFPQLVSSCAGLERIDFEKEMAIVIFAGEKATAGYAVKIESISQENGQMTVYYSESEPAPGSMVAQVITTPYAIKITAKTGLPVVFKNK